MRSSIEQFRGVMGRALLSFLFVGAPSAWSQVLTQGADVTNSRIVVDKRSHWSHWKMPTHAVDLVDDRVEFHYFRGRFNVVDDHETYQRQIPALTFRDKFKDHQGVGAARAVVTAGRGFVYDVKGEMRLRSDLKMDKYLDTHYLRYPGSDTHLVLDGTLYAITDASLTSDKEVELRLRNVETGSTSRRTFLTKDKNPAPVYEYFARMGVSRAGSNPPAPGALFDGDGTTYWEPSATDPLGDWWIEVDLGRSVLVDQIVLKFVDEELGDPFRQFRVSISPWQEYLVDETAERKAFGRSVAIGEPGRAGTTSITSGLTVAGRTREPNEDQRHFTFDLEPPEDAELTWTGRGVQVIRIAAFDTKGGRHTRLSPSDQAAAEAQWQALGARDKGDILYFVRSQEGFEEPVSAAEYERLPEDRQGRREYYRRERPRLADIEVWGLGDDLAPGIIAGGGSVQIERDKLIESGANMFDGDYASVGRQDASFANRDRDLLTADLGATFWLDQLRIAAAFLPGCRNCGDAFEGYVHWFSDGTLDATGNLKTARLSPFEREDITSPDIAGVRPGNLGHPFKVVDDYLWSPKVRYLLGRIISVRSTLHSEGGAYIREYHLFTRAYPAEVVLESDLIALPSLRNFGRVFWAAETPPGTRLEVRTRSGDRISRIVNYYNKTGEFWGNDAQAWESLGPSKGGTDTTFVPTVAAWTPWSNPTTSSGDWVASPGGRRFIQVQVKMVTVDREVAPTLRDLEIELTPPVGERIVAEVHPDRVTAPGVVDTFEVFIQPTFIDGTSSGFDELLLELKSGGMTLLDLSLGVDAKTGEAARRFRAQGEGFADEDGVALEVLRAVDDSLWVRFPGALNLEPETPLEYRRLTAEGDQVPTDPEGFPLTAAAWGLLAADEQGTVRYFRQRQSGLTEVSNQADYDALDPGEQGPIRYFRILQGAGEAVPFDAGGDSLTASSHARLNNAEKGPVVGAGQLVRIGYAAPVFRNGTTVAVAVRHTEGGREADKPWQRVEAGDATPMAAGNTLSIGLPLGAAVLDQVELLPNPFTPNGDGINDAVQIGFSVFKISADRQVDVSIYSLDGRRVWQTMQMTGSGEESVQWEGLDQAGVRVPPGLYLVRVALDADSDQGETSSAKLIAVAY